MKIYYIKNKIYNGSKCIGYKLLDEHFKEFDIMETKILKSLIKAGEIKVVNCKLSESNRLSYYDYHRLFIVSKETGQIKEMITYKNKLETVDNTCKIIVERISDGKKYEIDTLNGNSLYNKYRDITKTERLKQSAYGICGTDSMSSAWCNLDCTTYFKDFRFALYYKAGPYTDDSSIMISKYS